MGSIKRGNMDDIEKVLTATQWETYQWALKNGIAGLMCPVVYRLDSELVKARAERDELADLKRRVIAESTAHETREEKLEAEVKRLDALLGEWRVSGKVVEERDREIAGLKERAMELEALLAKEVSGHLQYVADHKSVLDKAGVPHHPSYISRTMMLAMERDSERLAKDGFAARIHNLEAAFIEQGRSRDDALARVAELEADCAMKDGALTQAMHAIRNFTSVAGGPGNMGTMLRREIPSLVDLLIQAEACGSALSLDPGYLDRVREEARRPLVEAIAGVIVFTNVEQGAGQRLTLIRERLQEALAAAKQPPTGEVKP